MSRFEVFLILGMTAVTFPVRYLPLAIVGRLQLPNSVQRALEYVPVAVLTAICTPTVLAPNGELWLRLDNAVLFASIAAIAIAWRFQHLLMTIVGGFAVFVCWRLLLTL